MARRLESAEAILRQGMSMQPLDSDNRLIHMTLGQVLKRRGDLQGALEQFKLELANNPAEEGVPEEIARIRGQLPGN
jgi:hypothetical protein